MKVRKRQLDGTDIVLEAAPCTCNSTYHSEACCDSAEGLVWEPRHAQLFPVFGKEL